MNRIKLSTKQVLILIVLFIVSQVLYKYFPQEIYLFKWTADRYYMLILIVLGLNYFAKYELSQNLMIGHVLGLMIGEIGGRIVYFSNIKKITPGMSPEEVYNLSKNPGVLIYFCVVIIFLLYGIFREKNKDKFKTHP